MSLPPIPCMASNVVWKGPGVLKGSSEPTWFGLTAGPKHPHTNMAKASLNMMTCSVADEFSKEGRLMGIGIFDAFKGYWTFVLALIRSQKPVEGVIFTKNSELLQVLQWFPSTQAGFPKCAQAACCGIVEIRLATLLWLTKEARSCGRDCNLV